jgi:hypothetical protein
MKTIQVKLSTWTKATAAIGIILIVCVWIVAVLLFGSTSAALAFLDGERLLVDSRSKSFGTVDPGLDQSVRFSLTNWTGQPVTIVGFQASCSCTMATDLPLSIPDGGTRFVSVAVKTAKLTGDFVATVRLFTDASSLPEVRLRVAGRFHRVLSTGGLDEQSRDPSP